MRCRKTGSGHTVLPLSRKKKKGKMLYTDETERGKTCQCKYSAVDRKYAYYERKIKAS